MKHIPDEKVARALGRADWNEFFREKLEEFVAPFARPHRGEVFDVVRDDDFRTGTAMPEPSDGLIGRDHGYPGPEVSECQRECAPFVIFFPKRSQVGAEARISFNLVFEVLEILSSLCLRVGNDEHELGFVLSKNRPKGQSGRNDCGLSAPTKCHYYGKSFLGIFDHVENFLMKWREWKFGIVGEVEPQEEVEIFSCGIFPKFSASCERLDIVRGHVLILVGHIL